MFDRAAEIGRGGGVVDDERHTGLVGHLGHGGDIRDMPAGIGDGLAEDSAGVVVNRCRDGVHVVDIDEFRLPTETLNCLAELRDRSAVKPGRDNDVAARRHQREKRHDLRRVTRGAADRADTAFEGGDTFLEHGDGRVRQPRIDVADFLQVEERRGVFCIAKHIGRCLVNRRLPRACCRVRAGARVDLQRVKAIGHSGSPQICLERCLGDPWTCHNSLWALSRVRQRARRNRPAGGLEPPMRKNRIWRSE